MIGTEGSTTITPDKELFEKYREKKEKEIEQMEQDQEVRLVVLSSPPQYHQLICF